jgi:hypothetical protein
MVKSDDEKFYVNINIFYTPLFGLRDEESEPLRQILIH